MFIPAERVSDITFQSPAENLAHSRHLMHSGGIELERKDSPGRQRDTKYFLCYLLLCSELEAEQPVWGYTSGFSPLHGEKNQLILSPHHVPVSAVDNLQHHFISPPNNFLQLESSPHFTGGEMRHWRISSPDHFIWKSIWSLPQPEEVIFIEVLNSHVGALHSEKFWFYQIG